MDLEVTRSIRVGGTIARRAGQMILVDMTMASLTGDWILGP